MRSVRYAHGYLSFVAILTLAAWGPQGAEANNGVDEPELAWLRDFLAGSSEFRVPASDDQSREVVTTRTSGAVSSGVFILEYERSTYMLEEPSTLDRRQLIMYRVRPAALDAATLSAQRLDGENGGEPSWVVSVEIREGAEFIPYDNLAEARKKDGAPELTRSRGRVRQVALGYFAREEQAITLLKKFRAYLNAPPAKGPDPVKRPAQSDA